MKKFIKPMLATLTNNYFSSSDWIYEEKFDGVRALAVKKSGKVSLMSRNEHLMNAQYPEIVQALEKDPADDFIIDGEIVALDKNGITDFQMLQARINLKIESRVKGEEKKIPIFYRVFDVLYAHDHDQRDLPLLERKEILKKLLTFNKTIIYTTHRSPDGKIYFQQACKKGWEGIIAKKKESTYVSTRSPAWLKFKCAMNQELVIVGYTEPKGSRTDFGALLVGYYADGKLIYAGKVGTGFSQETLHILGKKLRSREIKKCPLVQYAGPTKGVRWVKPELVGEFKFAQWTQASKLRVGRYQGLRTDKDARDVVKEVAKK